jgi:hypothetical protein
MDIGNHAEADQPFILSVGNNKRRSQKAHCNNTSNPDEFSP